MIFRVLYSYEKSDFRCDVMRWHGLTMISYKNCWGLSLAGKFRDRSLVERRAHFYIRRFCRSSCSAQASTRSLSWSALTSSWIRSCSRMCSSFASWRAFMASMSCYKTGASLPSDPCGPCLVFLITSEGSITNADGIKFYQALYRPVPGR